MRRKNADIKPGTPEIRHRDHQPRALLEAYVHAGKGIGGRLRDSRGRNREKPHESFLPKIKNHLNVLSGFLEDRSRALRSKKSLSHTLHECSLKIRVLIEKSLVTPDSVESIEEKLSAIDDEIGKCLVKCSAKKTIESLLQDAEAELSSMGHFMKEEHYSNIKRQYLLKKLREEYGIPRVSLYFK